MMKIKIFFFMILAGLLLLTAAGAETGDWKNTKDTHFVVLYQKDADSSEARKILRKAEYYYKKIADRIGYSRYTNFWTWDERVKIVLFSTKEDFLKYTGQPEWSNGYAFSHAKLLNLRLIVTYKQAENFLDGLLPHEISHLVLKDYIGFNRNLPDWFDEGVAQLHEKDKKKISYNILKALVKRNDYLPFDLLKRIRIQNENIQEIVTIFYAQSLTVVDFLITKYGSQAFSELCRHLREGRTMDEALKKAYRNNFKSWEDLETKWKEYMKRK